MGDRAEIGQKPRLEEVTAGGRGSIQGAGTIGATEVDTVDCGGQLQVLIVVDTVVDSVVDTVDCGGNTLDTFAWIGGAAGKCGEEDWEFSLSGICRTMLQRFMLRGPTKRENHIFPRFE